MDFGAIAAAAARVALGKPRCRCFTQYELMFGFAVENRGPLCATIIAASFPTDVPDTSRFVLRNLRELVLSPDTYLNDRMGLARSRLCLLVGRLYRARESMEKEVKAAHTVMSCLVQMLEVLLSEYAELISDSSPNGARRIRPYWFSAHELQLLPETRQTIAMLADQVSEARLRGGTLDDYAILTEQISTLVRTLVIELATSGRLSARDVDEYLDILASSPANNEWCAGMCG